MELGQGAEWGVPPLDGPPGNGWVVTPYAGTVLKQSEPQIAETFAILSGGVDD